MKKNIWLLTALCAFSLTAISCRAEESVSVVSVLDVTQDDLNAFMNGEHPDVAIAFPEATRLPLQLFLYGNVMHLIEDQQDHEIEVQETFYMRYKNGDFLFSSNLVEWKTFADFLTGNISIGLGVEEESGPQLSMGLVADFVEDPSSPQVIAQES